MSPLPVRRIGTLLALVLSAGACKRSAEEPAQDRAALPPLSSEPLTGRAERAIRFSVEAQSPGLGWKYGEKWSRNNTSVTGLMVLALKAGKTAGIEVPDTRKWRLEEIRHDHPIVDDLLRWRKAERIATTYGWRWLDEHVRAGRLRGEWAGSDGAAGRMTASAGLHNLPAVMRPLVAAEPGHALVRADLGQIEPRVLAAVSGDVGLIRATQQDDLYAPVAAALGVERGVVERFAVAADVHGELPAGATRERAGGDGEDQREKQSRAHGWLVLIGYV